MKQQLYINNVVFRILFPVIAGLILYLAMLMVFGSLDQLSESFLSQEALFIITLTHLYYMGIIQIGHLHAISMEQEKNHKEQLELELETFENEMNPDLLMDCLETLISLIHSDIQDAEKYIRNLSDHYR